MARRALRKIDPSLDFSQFLMTWEELPRPWDAEHIFDRVAPLEVEVGSGKGLFLQTAAKATPAHDFLGVEIATKYSRYTAARLAKLALPNAVVIHGDALRLFSEMLPDDSLAAVHVYFPDPWWKKRHHKRRVMNEQFVTDIARVLAPAGLLHFWTDVEERFEATLQLIAAETRMAGPLDVAVRQAEHDLDYRTHFERRMRLGDRPVFRAEFRKR
jgi:tRNA (guanine-N7-)-methyltransferase